MVHTDKNLDFFTGTCICYTHEKINQKYDLSILSFNLCLKLSNQWFTASEIIMLPVFVISNHFHLTSLTGICLHHCAIT